MIKNNLHYKSCPTEKCLKKVEDQGNNSYYCQKCQVTYPNFHYKYLISGVISDHTGSIWVNIFDVATTLFKIGPNDFIPLFLVDSNKEYCEDVFKDSLYATYNMKVSARPPTTDGMKPRYTLERVEKLDYIDESKKLITKINQYMKNIQ